MLNKPSVRYVSLGVLLVWALLAQLTSSAFITYLLGSSGKYLNVPFVTADYTTQIVALLPGYENSGLRVGDNVLALNDVVIEGTKQIDQVSMNLHPGDTLMITVRRSGARHTQTHDIPVVVDRYPSRAFGRVFVLGVSGFVSLSSVLLGFYVAFARPRDPLAWIAMLMLAAFGHFAGSGGWWAITWWWRDIVSLYRTIVVSSWPLWAVLLALYFPVPFDFIRSRPWLGWLFALPWIALAAVGVYGGFEQQTHIRELRSFATFWATAHRAAFIAFCVYVSGFFLLLTIKSRALQSRDVHGRLNTMIAGCSLALLPFVAVVLSDVKVLPRLPVWLTVIFFFMTLFLPITTACVVLAPDEALHASRKQ